MKLQSIIYLFFFVFLISCNGEPTGQSLAQGTVDGGNTTPAIDPPAAPFGPSGPYRVNKIDFYSGSSATPFAYYSFEYDSDNRLSRWNSTYLGTYTYNTYVYDAEGKMIKEQFYDKKAVLMAYLSYSYDANNRISTKTLYELTIPGIHSDPSAPTDPEHTDFFTEVKWDYAYADATSTVINSIARKTFGLDFTTIPASPIYNLAFTYSCEYTAGGQMSKITGKDSVDVLKEDVTYQYNSDNKPGGYIANNYTQNYTTTSSNQYNEAGHIIYQVLSERNFSGHVEYTYEALPGSADEKYLPVAASWIYPLFLVPPIVNNIVQVY
jgi:hypothetical protein